MENKTPGVQLHMVTDLETVYAMLRGKCATRVGRIKRAFGASRFVGKALGQLATAG